MNIEYLYNFVKTTKFHSISQASRELNITHTALSKQLKVLEDFFNINLFYRSTNGISLTIEGEQLYNRITPLLKEFETIKMDLSTKDNSIHIKLGTIPSVAAYYLPSKILSLKNKKIIIETEVCNTSEEILNLLKTGEIQAALIDRLPLHPSYWSECVFEESFYCIFPNNHPFSAKNHVTIDDLKNESLIVYPSSCTVRKKITSLMDKIGLKPTKITEVGFADFILGYVSAGAGVTILPKMVVEHNGHNGLSYLPINDQNAFRKMFLVTQSEQLGRLLIPTLRIK